MKNTVACDKQLDIVTQELSQRVEKVFLLNNEYYEFSKKELKYWMKEECLKDSISFLNIKNRLESMGYKILYKPDTIFICRYENSCDILGKKEGFVNTKINCTAP